MHIRVANESPIIHRSLALDRLEIFMGATIGFGFGFCDVWTYREAIYVETDVALMPFDRVLTIPCFIIARTTHRLLQDLRFYLDPAPMRISDSGGWRPH